MSSTTAGNQIVYICGEQNQPHTLEKSSLRDLMISNLAVYWSIRTHPTANSLDPRNEITEMYETIARSYVFVFIYSKETIEDSFYLNQYGIAKSYGVPVVGIRIPSYILPNPLPEQYYFTEIIYQTSAMAGNFKARHDRLNTNKKKTMLSDVLIHDFRNAVVYARDFHKSCIERLLHKVNSSYNKSEKEKRIFAALNNNTNPHSNDTKEYSKGWKYRGDFPKCVKCGFVNKSTCTPTLQRASSTGSLLRKTNAFDNETTANKNLKRTTLQPSTIQISSPYLSKSPLQVKMRGQGFRTDLGWEQNQKEKKATELFRGTLQSKTTTKTESDKSSNAQTERDEKEPKLPIALSNKDGSRRGELLTKQSRVCNTWTEKLKNKFRRQSSLPIMPTTYLLTTPDGLQTTMHFVKYPPETKDSPLSRSRDMSIFSEDEEAEIHISRVPSPDAPSF